jgi:hypothetical protein
MRDYLALLILPAFIIGGVLEMFLPSGLAFTITMGICAVGLVVFAFVTGEK